MAKQEPKLNEECPYCHAKSNIILKQSGYGNIRLNKLISMKEGKLLHVVCKNCGTVIRSYVPDIQNFL